MPVKARGSHRVQAGLSDRRLTPGRRPETPLLTGATVPRSHSFAGGRLL